MLVTFITMSFCVLSTAPPPFAAGRFQGHVPTGSTELPSLVNEYSLHLRLAASNDDVGDSNMNGG